MSKIPIKREPRPWKMLSRCKMQFYAISLNNQLNHALKIKGRHCAEYAFFKTASHYSQWDGTVLFALLNVRRIWEFAESAETSYAYSIALQVGLKPSSTIVYEIHFLQTSSTFTPRHLACKTKAISFASKLFSTPRSILLHISVKLRYELGSESN